jgi:hypothetical protein
MSIEKSKTVEWALAGSLGVGIALLTSYLWDSAGGIAANEAKACNGDQQARSDVDTAQRNKMINFIVFAVIFTLAGIFILLKATWGAKIIVGGASLILGLASVYGAVVTQYERDPIYQTTLASTKSLIAGGLLIVLITLASVYMGTTSTS